MISLKFDIDPVAKARPRFTRQGRAYTSADTLKFERSLRVLLASIRTETYQSGALIVGLGFWVVPPKKPRQSHPSVRPDLDNFVKAVLDAANGILWKDDGQIVELYAFKRYARGRSVGMVQIQVQKLEGEKS
jgi:Holliday junction resolvase RusA-like endonuclease